MPAPRTAALAAFLSAAAAALAGCSAAGAQSVATRPAAYTATAPLAAAAQPSPGGRRHAELAILAGATTITVGTARLGDDLLRVSAPAGGGVRPRLAGHGTVRLLLDGTGSGGAAAVRITLNSAVSWRLAFDGGTTTTSVFLGRGVLRDAEFNAGSSSIALRLPRPRGTVPIVLAGGASLVRITAPAGVPARLSLDGGAGHATLHRRNYVGIAGGTVLTSPGWATAVNRYDIRSPAGVSTISVGAW
jgi:hypothetical protein